jgi:hypothetical protein
LIAAKEKEERILFPDVLPCSARSDTFRRLRVGGRLSAIMWFPSAGICLAQAIRSTETFCLVWWSRAQLVPQSNVDRL